MATMKVILAESVPSLGDEGQVVNVKGGYARNFLIPKGIAFSASSVNAAQLAHKQKQVQDLSKRRIKDDKDLAKRLGELSIHIPVKVGEEDRVFGSVTSQNIADAISEKGVKINRRKIILKEPIRALGVYTVLARLSGDIESEVKVWVDKE